MIKLKARVGPNYHIELDLPSEIPQGTVDIIVVAGGYSDEGDRPFRRS
jgi:hypothetical protein